MAIMIKPIFEFSFGCELLIYMYTSSFLLLE
jgi:hypothetical protein